MFTVYTREWLGSRHRKARECRESSIGWSFARLEILSAGSVTCTMHQLLLVSLCFALAGSLRASNPCYDHQKQPYKAQFSPAECSQKCTVTPFFSPDHSIDAYMKLINEAQESIDLMEPSKLNFTKTKKKFNSFLFRF